MNTKEFTVLIVDDNTSNIDLLFHSLNSEYNILVAKNGTTAIKLAQEKIPDLVLLDIAMPGIDGFEVLEKLKESAVTAGIPVIFVTGKANFEDRSKGYQMGAVDYITKPFELEEVKTRVMAQLQLNSFSRDSLLMNEVMRDLKILYWRYDHQKKVLSTCGSLEGCIGVAIEENDIFSDAYNSLIVAGDREKRERSMKHLVQAPYNYSMKYSLSGDEKVSLFEKGMISKTEPHISFGYILNISAKM